MGFGKFLTIALFALIMLGSAYAVPGIPHQFYGFVTVDQAPADGIPISAEINGVERASTVSINGNYGFNPSIFYVPDPNSTNAGNTIEFFLSGGNTSVASYTFENGTSTRLDLYIGDAPECGDTICNLDETSETCPGDCGTGSVCGDGICDTDEDSTSCEADCGPVLPFCGDGACNSDETCTSCEAD